jgi:hypothetical protein
VPINSREQSVSELGKSVCIKLVKLDPQKDLMVFEFPKKDSNILIMEISEVEYS